MLCCCVVVLCSVMCLSLTQDEVGQLGVLQVVHHLHRSGEVVPDGEEQLGLGGRRGVHDAQLILAEERERGHGHALHLTLHVLPLVLIHPLRAERSSRFPRENHPGERQQKQRQQHPGPHVDPLVSSQKRKSRLPAAEVPPSAQLLGYYIIYNIIDNINSILYYCVFFMY